MLNEIKPHTALAGMNEGDHAFTYGSAQTVQLTERPLVALLNVRGSPDDAAFVSIIRNTTGITLPICPNTTAESDTHCALWLAPDEWLLRAKRLAPDDLASRLEHALSGIFSAITDQSSAYCVLHLRGPKTRELLAKGCPLDLHPRVFGAGRCAQSHYFKTTFLLRCLDSTEGGTWEFIVRRSFADYAVRMLMDGMWEYSLDAIRP
ncbi:sarcosine oxidase subunit gamma [Advenella kashmirensis W13003]|uniref:Sarcosine oxidase subunit gamma n=1 Tax=Advenella kashmirensis W13003 TaxID=1424334 RepID=V8QWM3_9BURK|nr:sarcosine oxidase subunit gamma family protein [Advenella kashmirensis]ETF03710.1 sarcosine oxidase subunit gamma [Advenella kashmirensis W13003]